MSALEPRVNAQTNKIVAIDKLMASPKASMDLKQSPGILSKKHNLDLGFNLSSKRLNRAAFSPSSQQIDMQKSLMD